ncbi:unnamed protein product [Brassica rapa subsp. narinosa]
MSLAIKKLAKPLKGYLSFFAMTIRIIVLMARQFRLLPASSILSLSSRIQSPFRLRTDGRIISCFLRKEEETTNILGFHGEILGPKQEPAPLEKNTTSRSKYLRGTSTKTLVRHDASEDMVNCKR